LRRALRPGSREGPPQSFNAGGARNRRGVHADRGRHRYLYQSATHHRRAQTLNGKEDMASDPQTRRSSLDRLTPRQIVEELDRYVIGQRDAKRMVAIALRNRWRRQQLSAELRDEVIPKNIIMIGPTGVGKTEIARRLAKLAQAPFLKIEASKFTEVGYVGRDVESIIRDLAEQAVNMVKAEYAERVQKKAAIQAEERLLDLLLPPPVLKSSSGILEEGSRDSAGPS